MEFKPFPKMARFSREVIITEKIDGTNASVHILPHNDKSPLSLATKGLGSGVLGDEFEEYAMFAASRTRFISPTDDNYGFAKWVLAHTEELWALGPGSHFGEWWGQGIQRRYGLTEKRFSLFNVQRWIDPNFAHTDFVVPDKMEFAPDCCRVVPILARCLEPNHIIHTALEFLRVQGSVAAPGFMDPEGIVIYHTAGNVGFKKTLKDDDKHKGQA